MLQVVVFVVELQVAVVQLVVVKLLVFVQVYNCLCPVLLFFHYLPNLLHIADRCLFPALIFLLKEMR